MTDKTKQTLREIAERIKSRARAISDDFPLIAKELAGDAAEVEAWADCQNRYCIDCHSSAVSVDVEPCKSCARIVVKSNWQPKQPSAAEGGK